ncbi:DUF1145 domain-containing protein [Pseudomonas sp. N040]|uniref:DUF1145 domain-containing protein n=1 Tax=Pseudomonas sp. N040 TaxID=2785325 RepID=UPI0018A30383|nr:DUF1145 domain-containing protein [Pseudomonas sp. N040]MBF7730582.1 DUF1145 domain-containing protein [Pseudomonas sp. N040]MBW7014226.1 DUF1145 domain-containing protein [Pseudomonas sp. N040]
MRYLLWAGKLGLALFWLALLETWVVPVAKPFGLVLGVLSVAIVLVHLLNLALLERQSQGRHRWLTRLQLLLFGAFHRPPMAATDAGGVQQSESRAGGGQAD